MDGRRLALAQASPHGCGRNRISDGHLCADLKVPVYLLTNKRLTMVCPLAAEVGFHSPRYRALRGPIAGEAVVTLATPEYPFRLPVASLTRTR